MSRLTNLLWKIAKATKCRVSSGTSTWDIYSDYKCFKSYEWQKIMLNLNAAPNMFNCMNGGAVAMSVRCNAKCDCMDCSDEDDCKVLDKLVKYNSRVLSSEAGGTAMVNFSAVVQLQDLNENAGNVLLKLGVSITWYDFRLTYLNLSPNR